MRGRGDDAVTRFFETKTRARWASASAHRHPRHREAGLADKLQRARVKVSAFGLVGDEDANIQQYVTRKTLDGLYWMIGEEERRSARTPSAPAAPSSKGVWRALMSLAGVRLGFQPQRREVEAQQRDAQRQPEAQLALGRVALQQAALEQGRAGVTAVRSPKPVMRLNSPRSSAMPVAKVVKRPQRFRTPLRWLCCSKCRQAAMRPSISSRRSIRPMKRT